MSIHSFNESKNNDKISNSISSKTEKEINE